MDESQFQWGQAAEEHEHEETSRKTTSTSQARESEWENEQNWASGGSLEVCKKE